MTATVHTFPVLADPPGLIEARAAFRSPDHMPLDVLETAAAVLRHSPHADDRLIAREWGNRLAEQMNRDHAEWSDEGRSPHFPSGWWIVPLLIGGLAFWASVIWLFFAPDAHAETIRKDMGGSVTAYSAKVDALRQSGDPVRITGDCYSACTMLLGLPQTCVSKRARLGFHGPSSAIYGIALTPARFDFYSRIMAQNYPEPIRRWFLTEGRYRLFGDYEVFSGAELIRNGVKECDR